MTFLCIICHEQFPCRYHLEAHLSNTHNAIITRRSPRRVYECPVDGCGMTYVTRQGLNLHYLRKHNGRVLRPSGEEMPTYHCTEPGCNAVFLNRDSVYSHRQSRHPQSLHRRRNSRSSGPRRSAVRSSAGSSVAQQQPSLDFHTHDTERGNSVFSHNSSIHCGISQSNSSSRSGRRSGSVSSSHSPGSYLRQQRRRQSVTAFQGTALQQQYEQDLQGSLLLRSEQDFMNDLDTALLSPRRNRTRTNREVPAQQHHEQNIQNSFWEGGQQGVMDDLDEILSLPRRNANHGSRW